MLSAFDGLLLRREMKLWQWDPLHQASATGARLAAVRPCAVGSSGIEFHPQGITVVGSADVRVWL